MSTYLFSLQFSNVNSISLYSDCIISLLSIVLKYCIVELIKLSYEYFTSGGNSFG